MFESAEIDRRIDKNVYKEMAASLRENLLEAQYEMQQAADFPILILIAGIEVAGKGESVKLLHEWLDLRHIQVNTFNEFSDEMRARPDAWRYWRQLPPKGRVGIFFTNWYTRLLRARVGDEIKHERFDQRLDDILRLEEMLVHEGILLLKLWFHLSKPQMKQRLKSLQKSKEYGWRLTPLDWHQLECYDSTVWNAEHMLRRTNRSYAGWTVIDCVDPRSRNLDVGRALLATMKAGLESRQIRPDPSHVVPAPPDNTALLASLDLSPRLERKEYKRELNREQRRLLGLIRDKRMRRHAVVAAFEGNDAAGKGGSIRRVTDALDPREYRIVPIAAPNAEEQAHPYLWRFWRQVPRRGGKLTIFDRSWYGRVLVERVEALCPPQDWLRAYDEINDFEEQLTEAGIIVVKFWLAIDKQTQLERFQARQDTPFKRYKITDEDWRNREKWGGYVNAVGDMVDRTSTEIAPWTLVEANDKRYARVKVLKTLNDAIEAAFAAD